MKLLLFIMIFAFTSCNILVDDTPSNFSVMSWNVQNLMDDKLDGTEYQEYTPSNGWDTLSYQRRLKTIADIIDDSSCDIVFLEEIENSKVLQDLLKRHLERKGYLFYGSVKKEGSAISLGFISKIRPTSIRVHSVTSQRPVLQVDVERSGEKISFFCCHAKSRVGGDASTEEERIKLTKTLIPLLEENKDHLFLVLGDFNEDVRFEQTYQTALIELTNKNYHLYHNLGSLGLSGDRNGLFDGVLYSPELDNRIIKSKNGTYYYKGIWYNYDQILGNNYLFDNLGIEFQNYKIESTEKLLTNSGIPNKWEVRGLSGISDHLPVIMTFKTKKLVDL